MPVARFEFPDGRIGRFEVPDGTTPDEATRLIEGEVQKGLPAAATPTEAPRLNFPLDPAVQQQQQQPAQPTPTLAGPSAVAGAGGFARPSSSDQTGGFRDTIKGLFNAEQERQISARQRTSDEVRGPDGQFLRPLLGEARLNESLEVEFDTSNGPVRADKNQHVVLRDPQTDTLMVFARTPETDQNAVLSAGQIAAPGLVTNAVAGPARFATRAATLGGRTVNVPTPPTAPTSGQALRAQRATDISQDAAAFERSGVRPFGPAFGSGPVAGIAKTTTEIPVVGPLTTGRALEESLAGTRDFARATAGEFGTATTAREAGEVAGQGLTRFRDARPVDIVDDAIGNLPDADISQIIRAPARNTTLKTKQAALYERAWRLIPEAMRRGRAVAGLTRVVGQPTQTRSLLQEIRQRNLGLINAERATQQGTTIANPVQGGLLGRMVEDVLSGTSRMNLQNMRNMRSEFRRLASGMSDTERNTLRLSDLERIQGTITEDMVTLLQRNADAARSARRFSEARNFERSIKEFRRADQFTRGSMERLESVERLFGANSVEQLAQQIKNAALGNVGNEQILNTLRRTLRPREMDQVRAAVIHEMGRPLPSARGAAQELGFSVNTFTTNYERMAPRRRAILFDGPHRQAIEDLGRMTSRLSNVEALANTSRSFSNAIGLGSLATAGGALATGGTAALLGSAAAVTAASVLFSRPSYVRWVIGWARLRAAAANTGNTGPLVSHVGKLDALARQDEALVPIVRAFSEELGITERSDRQEDEEQ